MEFLSETPAVKVNVPTGTGGDVIGQILNNLPVIGEAIGSIFGGLKKQNVPPPPPPPDLTPIYLMGGLILILTLTRK